MMARRLLLQRTSMKPIGASLFHTSRISMAVTPFLLADIGEGIAEVELMKWFVKKGDKVKAFDRLCEVQSDKATVEITSRFDGVITAVHYTEGQIAKVGSALVDIDQGASGAAKPDSLNAPKAPASTPAVSAPVSGGSTVTTPFLLADIGEGIAEVELMKWFVKKGDKVKAFDRLCEVQSDKATVEITSRFDGVITAVHYTEGQIAKVGSALVDIEVAGKSSTVGNVSAAPAVVPPAAAHSQQKSSHTSASSSTETRGAVLTTPSVRKIAKENSISLSALVGGKYANGPKGRILKEDILAYIRDGMPSTSSVPTSTSSVSSGANAATPAVSVVSQTPPSTSHRNSSFFGLGEMTKTVPIRGVQRLMVKSMDAARQVQTFVYADEVTVDSLVSLRSELIAANKRYGDKGLKISYMPLLLKAASISLKKYPMLNSAVNKDASEVTYFASHNVGVAMDTPKGLVVPVVKNVQDLSIFEIAAEIQRLQVSTYVIYTVAYIG